MFDDRTIIACCVIAGAAWLGTMTVEHYAPRADVTTAVNIARLPPLPLVAASSGAPAQTNVPDQRITLGDGFEAQLLFGYVIEGLVVTRREFRYDPTSAISPLDLGIVWGDLSKPGGIEDIAFSTAHRAVWSVPTPDADLPDDWLAQVTNNHVIPANQSVSAALLAVQVGSHVKLRGYLVEVTGDRIAPWRSSTRRGDNTITGGCEIILVTSVEVLAEGEPSA